MGQNPICNKILLRMFWICPFYMTLCSSWVDEVAENAEKRSMEAGACTEEPSHPISVQFHPSVNKQKTVTWQIEERIQIAKTVIRGRRKCHKKDKEHAEVIANGQQCCQILNLRSCITSACHHHTRHWQHAWHVLTCKTHVSWRIYELPIK